MKRILVFGLGLLVAVSSMAANLDEGTHELKLGGLIDFDTAAGEEVILDVGYGVFVIDNLEVGVSGYWQDSDEYTLWSIGGFGEYNFPLENLAIVPFVGAGLAYGNGEVEGFDSEDVFLIPVYGGAKYFLTEDVAISAQLNYVYASEDIYPEDDGEINDRNITITLSLRYYFDTVASTP